MKETVCNIKREEAVRTLRFLLNQKILEPEIADSLKSIANCIEAEMFGRHEWGIPIEDTSSYYNTNKELTLAQVERIKFVEKNIRFVPSDFERTSIENYLRSEYEKFFGESCTDADLANLVKY